MPKEKARRKQETPMQATIPPVVYVDSDLPSPVNAMPLAVTSQLRAMNGRDLKMMYLRPSLSMNKIERKVPVALKNDSGMLSTRELSLSLKPGMVMPAFSMMSGP